ncbi:hypothetical protein ACXDF8_09630 [Mycolicibacterium sp. CBM1]
MMTALGAVVYGGFFLLAALWLVVTGDYDTADSDADFDTVGADAAAPDQTQVQDRSNSASAPEYSLGSSL